MNLYELGSLLALSGVLGAEYAIHSADPVKWTIWVSLSASAIFGTTMFALARRIFLALTNDTGTSELLTFLGYAATWLAVIASAVVGCEATIRILMKFP
jgi:hypothetical protein